MKKYLALAILGLLTSTSLFANSCPQLEGVYSCVLQGTRYEMRIQQEIQNNTTVYTVHNDTLDIEVVTDGQRRTVDHLPNNNDIRNASYTASCPNASRVSVVIKADLYSSGSYLGALTSVLDLSRRGNQIESRTTISLGAWSQPPTVAYCNPR